MDSEARGVGMETEQRGRASRASSTSSLGREVRCGCQYYQSDSLLPERRALLGRPSSRTMQQPPAVRCSEHEYEPIAAPSPTPTATSKPPAAPVVRITDTDMMPVADSDDSIDDRGHNLPPELTRDGDVVLPLDGKLEDNAMEGRELGEAGDTSEELETPQQLQDRLEERFLSTATPGTESRTDGEVNTSQVDSLALEELPLRRGARGLPQRLKTQAGKLRTRLRNIQRPTFAFSERQKPEKTRSTSSGRSDRSRSEKRPTRMERIRSSFSERPKFSLPSRPKFNFPDRSKFHLPERPKFNLPERAKFHLPERPKFNIKKPNIRLPAALTRAKKSPTVPEERSTDSTIGSKRNIFDFATYPRMFDRKSKNKGEFATSTPKDSRAQSTESATLPRARKGTPMNERWAQRFDDTAYIDEDRPDAITTVERSRPWRHPSLEQPRLSIRTEEEVLAAMPWESKRGRERDEELQFMDYEQESPEISERRAAPKSVEASRTEEESFEGEPIELDPRLYGDQNVKHVYSRVPKETVEDEEEWEDKEEMTIGQKEFRPIKRSHSLGEDVLRAEGDDRYEGSFPAVDPRRQYGPPKFPSEEEEYEDDIEADEELEPSSAHSDREQQQSSGSSCDRRRRGIIEEIDSDEFFLRASGLNQDEVNLGKYFTHEIRDALKAGMNNALADDSMMGVPPQRPMRTRSLRKRKESSVESYEVAPPIRPKRDQARSRRSESGDDFRERTRSDSRHRVVYQAEGSPREMTPMEPLDDIVVVKPLRRKSRSSQRSQSQISSTPPEPPTPTPLPPTVPSRRKRSHRDTPVARRNGDVLPMCNGHTEWARTDSAPEKPLPLPPTLPDDLHDDREILTAEDIMAASEEDIRQLVTRLRQEQFVEPFPIPPKRRSRSRGTSVAQDEDRTSHGAESLPEAGYFEEDIPQDDLDFGRDLSGYAIIDKREKPPRPPPPRRRREKFATTPRPIAPKRPQRAYSTLGPGKSRETSILSDVISTTLEPGESTPYIEIDSDEGEQKDLRSGQVLSKMQGRPLPAPPRPPRVRKDRSFERSVRSMQEFSMESTIATQTDPLPDDMIIEEEVTQAKLVVAPSMSGSQVLVSMERIPSPSAMSTPPVPPLPVSQRLRREEHVGPAYDTVSLKSPSPIRDLEELEDRHLSAPQLEEPLRDDEATTRAVRAALLSEETIRIGNLEVGDLRVDRLSVSQIEAGKIVASEVDALVITASELRNMGGSLAENLSPSIINELIAIRSHLEAVAASRAQEIRAESIRALEQQTKSDIPAKDTRSIDEEPRLGEAASGQQPSTAEDRKSKSNEDQKVVKREVIEVKDNEIPTTRTLSVAQVEVKDNEMLVTNTLAISQLDIRDKEIPTTHSLTVHQDTQDKSLRILDTESPISLRTGKEPKVEESRASLPPSARSTPERTEPRLSPQLPHESTIQQPESDSKPPPEFATYTAEPFDNESSPDYTEKKPRKSRSRSPSPSTGIRQTASPVRSLPPVISVTPDSPDTAMGHGISSETQQPQRAVISYSSYTEHQSDMRSERESQRESSQSPIPSFPPLSGTHFIAIPTSQLPAQFFSMVGQASQRIDSDPSVSDTMRQLIRALRLIGIKAMRHFVGFVSSSVAGEESREKIREVELTLCALLLLIAGLLVFFFGSTKTVTHHHHWDYFNPPQ